MALMDIDGTDKGLMARQHFAMLRASAARAMRRHRIPGAAFGVAWGTQTLCTALGVTNIEDPLHVTPDTIFQIGSVTKVVTATAAMRLVEMGKLELDQPIADHVHEISLVDREIVRRVTLRHLLTHTGGWEGDYFPDFGEEDDALQKLVSTSPPLPQLTALGATWSYNNAGFYLVGRLIECLSGKTYEKAVRELVFDALHITHAHYSARHLMSYRVASGHWAYGARLSVVRPWGSARVINPLGGLLTSIPELLRFVRSFFIMPPGIRTEPRSLQPATAELMVTPQVAAGSMADHCGLSWLLQAFKGELVVTHMGASNGQMCSVAMVPRLQFAFAIVSNSSAGTELNRHLVDLALGAFLGLERPRAKALAASAVTLSEYTGVYESPLLSLVLYSEGRGLVLHVVHKEARLGASASEQQLPPPIPPVRLAFLAKDHVEARDAPLKGLRGEFVRSPSGTIGWFRFFGRLARATNSQSEVL
jgi:CubicO group peptidase (beta-lactamase class C family)